MPDYVDYFEEIFNNSQKLEQKLTNYVLRRNIWVVLNSCDLIQFSYFLHSPVFFKIGLLSFFCLQNCINKILLSINKNNLFIHLFLNFII